MVVQHSSELRTKERKQLLRFHRQQQMKPDPVMLKTSLLHHINQAGSNRKANISAFSHSFCVLTEQLQSRCFPHPAAG